MHPVGAFQVLLRSAYIMCCFHIHLKTNKCALGFACTLISNKNTIVLQKSSLGRFELFRACIYMSGGSAGYLRDISLKNNYLGAVCSGGLFKSATHMKKVFSHAVCGSWSFPKALANMLLPKYLCKWFVSFCKDFPSLKLQAILVF